jgi:hypothetical protein
MPPVRFLTIHKILILFFMVALSQKWFLTSIPYDCFYLPFLIVSGPPVYFLAHYAQHYSEGFFTAQEIMITWNLVPGIICLIFGGFQWVVIEYLLIKFWESRKKII